MTDPAADQPTVRRGATGRVAVGALAGGMAALVVALFLPAAPARADGLPVWVRIVMVVLLLVGIGAVVLPRWHESPWIDGRRWRIALGLGATGVGTWAVFATVADIRSGLPGLAIPLLAVGCVALLVAAVLLAVVSPVWRVSVVREAVPAAVVVLTVAAVAVAVEVAVHRIPVDATTAERVEPAGVPDPPDAVGWTSTWPLARLGDFPGMPIQVVAAGAGVIVASGDRIVAIDGSTGIERWHYRQAGAWISRLTATPDGRTVAAVITAGSEERSSPVLMAFDANTGEVRWSRPSTWSAAATNHTLVNGELDDPLVGIDLGSGEETWRWTPPADCEHNGLDRPGPDTLLVPVICRDRAGAKSYALIGLDDRTGTERWRFTGPSVTGQYPDNAHLTTSPDGRVVAYKPTREDQVLLESATGAVRYRTDGDTDIIAPDPHTPVLQREFPGGDAQLVLRDLTTRAEHTLASTCPALRRPDRPSGIGQFSVLRPVVTSTSVQILCYDGRAGAPARVTIDMYSRTGATTGTINATDIVDTRQDESGEVGLIPAPGAVVLVVQHYRVGPAAVVGLM